MRSAPRVSAYASLAALLAFASACEGNNQPVSLSVRPDVLKATVPAALGTENTTCLHHSKVVANVEYTCADGKKHKGTALPRPEAKQPPACATDGETACLASGAFAAAETKALASKVLSGQTVAGVAGNITLPLASAVRSSATIGTNGATSGSIADCASDGQSECFVPASGAIKAANTANFTAWDVRRKRSSSGAVLTLRASLDFQKRAATAPVLRGSTTRRPPRQRAWTSSTPSMTSTVPYSACQETFRPGRCLLAATRSQLEMTSSAGASTLQGTWRQATRAPTRLSRTTPTATGKT